MVEGMMAFGKLETGQRTLDFECCEDVAAEAFRGHFSSLSHGKDKKYYFFFSLDEDQLELLPEKLVNQASAIAQKVIRELMKGRGYRQ